jgi:DNA-binding HxlR family transcriptional regulator
MLHSRYPGLTCSVARALEVIGERWSLLIVRDALRGVTRFEDFQRSLGLARNVLTARLDHLVSEGVLVRTPYGPKGSRSEYELTDKGRELGIVVIGLSNWGDRHYANPAGPPRSFEHPDCGGPVRAQLVCDHDHEIVAPADVRIVAGPGLPADRQ